MTLDQLRKETQLTLDEIRQSLLVGIQHNFIFYTESIVKDIAINHYSVNIDNVNIRIRFAKFILHTKERFGDRVSKKNYSNYYFNSSHYGTIHYA
jgi:hypothetical protein